MPNKEAPFKKINKTAKRGIKKKTSKLGEGPGIMKTKPKSRKQARKGNKFS